MKKLQFIDIGKPFRIIGKICKDIERAFRFKGINVNFIVMMIDYIGFAFILKWNLHLEHGKLVENGSVIDIFSKPKSTIAKRFVETVIPSKIPESIVAELKKYEANYKVIRIFFHAEHATDDVIWQINAKLGVHTNVMFASVTELQGRVLSIITLQLTGNEGDFKKVEDYINSHGIAFEEVPV